MDFQPDPKTNMMKKRIAPGFWIDQNGHPHISIPEVLAAVGMEDTPENRALALAAAREALAKVRPDVVALFRENESDPGKIIC